MIFGDPSKFAVSWEIVDAWSTKTIKNGLFSMYVDFKLLGNRKNIVHALGANLHELLKNVHSHEEQTAIPTDYLSNTPEEIFSSLCEYTFPKRDYGQNNGREYLAVPFGIYDEGDVAFFVRNGTQDRIYYGTYDGKFGGSVVLSRSMLLSIVSEAEATFKAA